MINSLTVNQSYHKQQQTRNKNGTLYIQGKMLGVSGYLGQMSNEINEAMSDGLNTLTKNDASLLWIKESINNILTYFEF